VAVPTGLDVENARRRRAIADRFREEFEHARTLAERVLGAGWEPTGRHALIDKADEDRCRRTGERPVPAAVVLTARNAAGDERHVRADGEPRECPSMEAGFGDMLAEPHPTLTIDVFGKAVAPHRYSLYWSGFEPDYRPQSAEQLAAARERREQKAVETEAEGNLFAELIRAEGYVPPKRKR
jgi:hypothetical protein